MSTQVRQTDLAAELRVHPSTVSLALRDSPEVSEAMRFRVKQLAGKLRYSPNLLARSFRRRKTETLGVLFPYATLPAYGTLLDAIDAEADRRGLHLEVHFHQWSTQQEVSAVQTLLERRVDGIIAVSTEYPPFPALCQQLPLDSGFPVAMVGSFEGQSVPSSICGCVDIDSISESQRLGEHLLEMGHRRIALVTPLLNVSHTESGRVRGLELALERCSGTSLQVVSLEDSESDRQVRLASTGNRQGFSAESQFSMLEKLVERVFDLAPLPTAVLTSGGVLALLLLSQLHRRGLRVPEDVSVASYDGTFLSACATPALTCMKTPVQEVARHLMELVLSPAPAATKRKPEVRLLQSSLVIRDSVARVPVDSLSDSKAGRAFKAETETQRITKGEM